MRPAMKVFFVIILFIYMLINLLAILGNGNLRKSKIKLCSYFIASFFVIITCVMIWKNEIVGMIPCFVALLIYSICAVHNGYILHGKPKMEYGFDCVLCV